MISGWGEGEGGLAGMGGEGLVGRCGLRGGGALFGSAGEGFADGFDDIGFDDADGGADAAGDGFGVGASVSDENCAVDAEERCAADAGVIPLVAEGFEGSAHEPGAGGVDEALFDALAEFGHDALDDAFGDFDGDIAGEAIGDDDVGHATDEGVALDVADEVGFPAGEELVGFLDGGGAFGAFLADVEESNAGVAVVEDALEVGLAHGGELAEVVGADFGVCADVEDERGGTA